MALGQPPLSRRLPFIWVLSHLNSQACHRPNIVIGPGIRTPPLQSEIKPRESTRVRSSSTSPPQRRQQATLPRHHATIAAWNATSKCGAGTASFRSNLGRRPSGLPQANTWARQLALGAELRALRSNGGWRPRPTAATTGWHNHAPVSADRAAWTATLYTIATSSTGVSAIERAFELAATGRFATVTEIKLRLAREGYRHEQVEGPALAKQITAIIENARHPHASKGPAAAKSDE